MITSTNANLATYVCSGLALAIILVRLLIVRIYKLKLDTADWMSMFGVAVITARLINDHYLLVDGTANDALNLHLTSLTTEQLHNIKIGSILALVARLFDTTFFWLQIAVLLLFYSNLLHSISWVSIAIKICWSLLATTYIAVIAATFAECNPFRLYWQIYPNPGQCAHAYIQLSLQAGCNIMLDLIVLAISIPLLRLQGRSTSQKVRITVMVCLGLFTLIITCVRLPLVVQDHSAQQSRTFFASIQLLTSTFVANMPTIYGRVQNGRRKRAEQLLRRESVRNSWQASRSSTTKTLMPSRGTALPMSGLEEKTGNDSATIRHQEAVNDVEIV